jgi:hypothetical protein
MGLVVTHHPTLGWTVYHSGGLPGYGSNMRWIPGTGVGAIALANVTYARMAECTSAMVDVLATHHVVRRPKPPAVPALQQAAVALVALLRNWDDSIADALFADNVFLDESRERRKRAAAELYKQHGAFALERVVVESGASATAVVRGDKETFEIAFDVAPLVPVRIQFYEVL